MGEISSIPPNEFIQNFSQKKCKVWQFFPKKVLILKFFWQNIHLCSPPSKKTNSFYMQRIQCSIGIFYIYLRSLLKIVTLMSMRRTRDRRTLLIPYSLFLKVALNTSINCWTSNIEMYLRKVDFWASSSKKQKLIKLSLLRVYQI